MSNHLINETSPYLLQHAENPVEWYPWGKEAFDRARKEDKPVFLSIGYSTCHWCHVMAHESFEDQETADILNRYFISIKVDKEQRPDIDSIYMSVCQAFTGSGGWPTSIFMTALQKPFFAGTYFPKVSHQGMISFRELLFLVQDKWENDRENLLSTANEITDVLNQRQKHSQKADKEILDTAVKIYKQTFDRKFGGFGDAPKFPAAHNLLFLMKQYRITGDEELLEMVEKTLVQMYRGGLFDHIGYGFCRYSTDRYFLVPHFEKMLYDNALLILAYCKAYDITQKNIYKETAVKVAYYVLSEMTSTCGGFYSAQDADSDGVEGKYYVFRPEEIIELLGNINGTAFNECFGITKEGNFEGKSIPNLLYTARNTDEFNHFMPKIREYRRSRCSLHTDDKMLTAWNSLMISALCAVYKISNKEEFLKAAKKAQCFIERDLCKKDLLYVSIRDQKHGERGFLDDYAFYCYALIGLYNVTLDNAFLDRTMELVDKTVRDFFDHEDGGFYLYGRESENLISRPKESYDGAMPSGNSMMAYILVQLNFLRPTEALESILQKQITFMSGEAERYPAGYAMFLVALSDYFNPPEMITAVVKQKCDLWKLTCNKPANSIIKVLETPTDEYKLLNDKTTYYICKNHTCLPPVNELEL